MLRISVLIITVIVGIAGAEEKLSEGLLNYVKAVSGEAITVWVYFKDKGPPADASLAEISERALWRRQKRALPQADSVTDDLPVYGPYLSALSGYVKSLRVTSRWLNAASAEVDPAHLDEIAGLDFVCRIDRVMTYLKHFPVEGMTRSKVLFKVPPGALDYGTSYDQLQQIGVTALHERGLYGQGVLICLLDDGFNLYRTHECFDSLEVIDTRDFINQDDRVDDPEAEPLEGWHGTMTLSVIAGYAPGRLIGPAFRASYLLGKTEVDYDETAVEEDYWVAGLEWAEANGADIVSSSLGYFDWYTWEDMDGETPVTTFAADLAASRGVAVVNSAGNEGYNAEHNTLGAPSDGDLVIAVGSVTAEGTRSGFSSVGPTADGRIKPDVAARGSSVWVASYCDSAGYTYASGTSFSCPLVAGAIAQLLTADPSLTVPEIREALTATASQADAPDNLLGWGIINAETAHGYLQTQFSRIGDQEIPIRFTLEQNYPNPFNSGTVIPYSVGLAVGSRRAVTPQPVELTIYNIMGQKITTLVSGIQPAGEYVVRWDASEYPSGIYFVRLETSSQQATVNSRDPGFRSQTRKMILVK